MDTFNRVAAPYHNAYAEGLSLDAIRSRAPAAFSNSAHGRMSSKYVFLPTERILGGLMQAGLVPVSAHQTRSRSANALYSRHMIRLRRRFEYVRVNDAIPEVILLNSHDGTSAYQLRVGLYRVLCSNGLIVSAGTLPMIRVLHRQDVLDEIVRSALEITERFELLAIEVERMEQRTLGLQQQIEFAQQALVLRFPDVVRSGLQPSQLLTCHRREDDHNDLWCTLNRVQENLLRGGVTRRLSDGRLSRLRSISSIRENVRLNSGLWDLARGYLAA